MPKPERLRTRLAERLRAAYQSGLLSQETFSHRLDELLRPARVEPEALVGDLTFRDRRARLRVAAERVQVRLGLRSQPSLLALDWSGANGELLLGRHSSCDVVLADPEISRRHARLIFRDGRWVLIDLGSTNGTYLNGRLVHRAQLQPGDVLDLGHQRLQVD